MAPFRWFGRAALQSALTSGGPGDPAALVDPLIGTSGSVNCFPGATLPFGMIQWSPDTPSRPFGGGYEYDDESITGFSVTHLSGPGCPVFGDVPILPTVGGLGDSPGHSPADARAGFSHAHERAEPGSYSVRLSSAVTTRLAVTTRAGIGEFTFPPRQQANVLVKLTGSATEVSAASAQIVSDTEISGSVTSGGFCGGPNSYTLYFALRFERRFASYGVWSGGLLRPETRLVLVDPWPGPAGVYVTFDTATNRTVRVKVGVSYVSEDNARANIDAETPDWNFGRVQNDARERWNALLRRIEIDGGTEREQRIFYTALYHSLLHPNVSSDANGEYLGFDGRVHAVAPEQAQYANYSGWDVYRCQIPLIALIAPHETSDIIQSMVNDYAHSGLLPKWSVASAESFIMVGDPAAPIIAGAYAFGAREFDVAVAFEALARQAREPTHIRPGLDQHERLGYLPLDGDYGCCNFYGPVSTQLEYDTADFALAAFADTLGDTATARALVNRAQNWVNLFDAGTGFLRPKLASGAFLPDFDPSRLVGFVEGNAWQYTPMVPFNVHGLINAMGGAEAFVAYLDAFFAELNAGRAAPYAWMGNEPCLGIPWMYAYAGAPYKAQQVVRRIQQELYTDGPAGEPGNDDLGTMSSWFVWSALGLYPATPGTADLVVSSPLFPRMRLRLGEGKQISIDAPDASPDTPYIRGLEMNGQPWSRAFVPRSVVTQGAHLRFDLGADPASGWASGPGAAPPSYDVGQPAALGFLRPDYRVSLACGERDTVTLGVRALADGEQIVTWTADVPDGLALEPAAGRLRTRPGADGTVPLQIEAGSAPGSHVVAIRLATSSGTSPPDLRLEIVVT
jgi:predicted alpha-1,2-mannosidase